MTNLVYKELRISINKFFYLLPLLLAGLMFIPHWIFTLVFMYFFWISAPQIYSAYLAEEDYAFCSMLPVTKKDIVTSKAIAVYIVEGLHLGLGIITGIAHNMIYGSFNLFFDINPAFFGMMFILFGIFNIVFLPNYFKTGYYFGKPIIIAIAATMVYGFIIEYGVIKFAWMRSVLESTNNLAQIALLLGGILVSVILSTIAIKQSVKNYESIE